MMIKRLKYMINLSVFLIAFMAVLSTEIRVEASSLPVGNTSKAEWEVLKIVNKERIKQNRKPLSTYTKLQKATDVRTKELKKSFSHTRPTGKAFYTALAEAGVSYNYAGENIAYGYQSSKDVMKGWMNSPGHKNNILSTNYAHIGVGYYNSSNQKYWTQLFTGGCTTTSISVKDAKKLPSYKRGTTIENMNLVLEVKCSHGTSYAPVITEMVSGYKKNTAGTQNIKITYGNKSVKVKVKIKAQSIKNAVVTNIKSKTYNGKNQTQSPKVVLNGKILKKNVDYKLTYSNNKNVGTAKVIIKGIGNYTGTITKTFKIKK